MSTASGLSTEQLRDLAASTEIAKTLSAKGRKQIDTSNFAIPEKRAYPIHDLAHARNALARVAQHGSADDKRRVRAAVHRKFPQLG